MWREFGALGERVRKGGLLCKRPSLNSAIVLRCSSFVLDGRLDLRYP
jgi:hypothetical protein